MNPLSATKPSHRRWVVIPVAAIAAIQLSGIVCFFFVYPWYRTDQFRKSQSDQAIRLEVELDERARGKTLTVEDPKILHALNSAFSQARYFHPNHPGKERQYYARVFRESSRIDEYEILLDLRGAEYDFFHVVHRSGNTTWYGSSFQAAGLRDLVNQLSSR